MNELAANIIFTWNGNIISSESQKTKTIFHVFHPEIANLQKQMALYLRRNIFRLLPYVLLSIMVDAIF